MLTIIAFAALMFLAMFDYIRGRIFMIIGERIARRLGAITLQASVRESLRMQSATGGSGMRDLQELRQFLTGGSATIPFDLLMAPLFITVLFMMHPLFGAVAIFAVVVLTSFGIIMDLLVRQPAARANEAALASYADVAAAIRRAEILESMGMLPAIARRWRRGQSHALHLLGAGNGGAKALGAIARSVRMALQITMLATGAVLVIKHEASAGSIMATTMIMGRLLLPFEQMIDGWRQWTHAGSALSASSDLPEQASRRWRGCWSVSGNRRQAASISTDTTSTPGSARASEARLAICPRIPGFSTAPSGRISVAFATPTRLM
jgi:ATP-binding cassette subfamily C protein